MSELAPLDDETDEIRDRLEELDVMLHAMRQASEALALFLKPREKLLLEE